MVATIDNRPMWVDGHSEAWDGARPFWVRDIRHYLSKSGKSVAVCVSGTMHPDSRMPGGYKRIYFPVEKFKATPKQCINVALNRSEDIRLRCYGSHIVWAFRNNFDKQFLLRVGARLKKRGYKVYSPGQTRCHEFLRRILVRKGVFFSPESLNFLPLIKEDE